MLLISESMNLFWKSHLMIFSAGFVVAISPLRTSLITHHTSISATMTITKKRVDDTIQKTRIYTLLLIDFSCKVCELLKRTWPPSEVYTCKKHANSKLKKVTTSCVEWNCLQIIEKRNKIIQIRRLWKIARCLCFFRNAISLALAYLSAERIHRWT